MNRLFYLLLVFLPAAIHAQQVTLEQAEAYANELVKNDFLTEKGKTVLLQEMKTGEIEVENRSIVKPITYVSNKPSKETILLFCRAALESELWGRLNRKGMAIENKINPKETGIDSTRSYTMMPGWSHLRKEYKGCISHKTSVIGQTRVKTLNTFYNAGLIDEKIFNDCQAALQSKEIRDELDLLQYMLERSMYYRHYDFNKKEQTAYIAALAKHGLLSEEGKEILLRSYKEYELKTIPEILKQSPRYAHVDLHAYESNPKITYPVIFDALQKLLPQFKYSDLTVQIVEKDEGDLIEQKVRLSFKIDTSKYTHNFFHDYRKKAPTPDDPDLEPSKVDQDFHKGINRWLTDIESPFRLYTVNILDKDERAYGERSVGLLLLKEGEDTLVTSDSYAMSKETFDQRLSRKNIKKFLAELSQSGFFSHLTAMEIDTAEEKVASEDISSLDDVLLQFPKTVVVFDWETGNLENPYEEITAHLVAASRGAFTVSNITDEFKRGWKKAKKVKYGFTMNGKRYEKMLKFEDDWLDPDFLDMIQSALKENNVNGNFYYCVDNGQVTGYIFLNKEQYNFLKEKYPGLLKGYE